MPVGDDFFFEHLPHFLHFGDILKGIFGQKEERTAVEI